MVEIFLAMLLSMGLCTSNLVTEQEFLVWGTPGTGVAQGPVVPNDKVWLVRSAGVSTTDNTEGEYMIELQRPVKSQGGACCWNVPVARTSQFVYGTPPLALEKPLVMYPGERLRARENGWDAASKVGILGVYYEIPRSCVPVTP
jgi:hypothetical protein